MNGALNKEILRLAIPSILANITIPLVGMVATGVAGHIPPSASAGAATYIAAMSLGSMLFSLLYWNFTFLRTGSGGLTAQAFGRNDMRECARIFYRAIGFAIGVAVLAICCQWPYVKFLLLVTDAPAEVESLALTYFRIRIWAAPATLSLMAFSGWFVGMQDSVSSMFKDLIVNIVNLCAGIVLSLGIGEWKGMGFAGLPLATIIAQYSGLTFCIIRCRVKYGKTVFSTLPFKEIPAVFQMGEMRRFLQLNADLFVRSLGFMGIYIGYTMIAARFGEMALACSSILMQMLMLFSYFTDGFSYAGEALTGRYIGAGDEPMMRSTVHHIFAWSMGVAVLFVGIYWKCGLPILHLLTSDAAVVDVCGQFVPWMMLMPVLGSFAFTWDGIYLGATVSKPIRNAMLLSSIVFVACWFMLKLTIHPEGVTALHCLMAAYFSHLLYRSVHLTITWRRCKVMQGVRVFP